MKLKKCDLENTAQRYVFINVTDLRQIEIGLIETYLKDIEEIGWLEWRVGILMCCVRKALNGAVMCIQRAGHLWVEMKGHGDARQRELKIVHILQPRVGQSQLWWTVLFFLPPSASSSFLTSALEKLNHCPEQEGCCNRLQSVAQSKWYLRLQV